MKRRDSRYALLLCLTLVQLLSADGATNHVGSAEHRKFVDSLWRRIERGDAHMSSRGIFDFVLEAAAARHGLEHIESALAIAERMQDRAVDSMTYGNLAWYLKDGNRVDDRNAVQFCMQKASLVWMLYRSVLPDNARERLRRLIDFGVEGIVRHRVSESYTNIYLMKMWNCIALGEGAGFPELARTGYAMCDAWLLYTARCGIHEYGSPTYYGVDLECLGLIARHAQREPERRKARAGLALLWADIAANWYGPAQRLGGAHSRDYDYLTGHGYLDRFLKQTGWLPSEATSGQTAFLSLCVEAPPEQISGAPFTTLPRFVQQRWGSRRNECAQHYVGKRFSIGSAGGTYGPMDKVLTVNLPGGPKMPMMYVFMDARNDAYGKKRYLTGGGHSKALHLEPDVVSVQEKAEVLLAASVAPGSRAYRRMGDEATCLLSHVVIPAAADVYAGSETEPLDPALPLRRLADPHVPVLVRFEDIAVGVRVVVADGQSGAPVRAEVVNDGTQWAARRLTCVHCEGPLAEAVTVAVWVRAEEGLDDAGFARFRRAFAAAQCDVERSDERSRISVSGVHRSLGVQLGGSASLADEWGDDPDAWAPVLLSVNGKRIGRDILGSVDVVRDHFALVDSARNLASRHGVGDTLEAESDGVVFSAFEVGRAEEALSEAYIWVPGPVGQDGGREARAVWAIRVPEHGRYSVWGRIRAPTPKDDSFYVRLVQNGSVVWPRSDWHVGVREQWTWVRFPADITLDSGDVRLEILAREDGACLDAVYLGQGRTGPFD